MGKLDGFFNNFDNIVNSKIKTAIMNKIPYDLQLEIQNEGGEVVIDYTTKTFVLRGCSEELSQKVIDALKPE